MSPAAPAPIRLVPLLCFKCRAPLLAKVDEIAWVCEQCGQGLLLDPAPAPGPSECSTRPLEVLFSNAVRPGQKGRPFWVARGQVTITRRDTYKGDEGRAAREFWAAPRMFSVPAWETSLDEIVSLGVSLLKSPPRIEPRPDGSPAGPVPFLPAVTPPGDTRALAEFVIVSIEAERRDYLKTVTFDLRLDPAQLWVLP